MRNKKEKVECEVRWSRNWYGNLAAIFAQCEISVTNIDNFFLNLTFANLSNRFRSIGAINFLVAEKRQKDKHAIREKRHIVTANSDGALINFDTFGFSFSFPFPLSCSFNSPGGSLLSLSTVRWLWLARFPVTPLLPSFWSLFVLSRRRRRKEP